MPDSFHPDHLCMYMFNINPTHFFISSLLIFIIDTDKLDTEEVGDCMPYTGTAEVSGCGLC